MTSRKYAEYAFKWRRSLKDCMFAEYTKWRSTIHKSFLWYILSVFCQWKAFRINFGYKRYMPFNTIFFKDFYHQAIPLINDIFKINRFQGIHMKVVLRGLFICRTYEMMIFCPQKFFMSSSLGILSKEDFSNKFWPMYFRKIFLRFLSLGDPSNYRKHLI